MGKDHLSGDMNPEIQGCITLGIHRVLEKFFMGRNTRTATNKQVTFHIEYLDSDEGHVIKTSGC